jgi:hypothetical protein
MSDVERDAYLARMYYDTSKVGSYSGLKGYSLAIKKDVKFKFTKAQIEEWLRNQDAFSLQKPLRGHGSSRRVSIACGIWTWASFSNCLRKTTV